MSLGIFFSIGGSLKNLRKLGQLERFFKYLDTYNKAFDRIYIFSYEKENCKLPEKCTLVPNRFKIHRYLYQFLIPVIERYKIKQCSVSRVTQITGSVPAFIAKLLYKIPYLATYGFDYSLFAKTEHQIIASYLIKPLETLAIKFADAIIVTNKSIKENLSVKFPDKKLIYIPNGVDTAFFKPSLHKSLPKKTTVLFVGRLVKQKNLKTLIEAINISKNKNNIKLTFVGDGPEREKLQSLARKLNINLIISGFRPFKKLIAYYLKADIFVLPSVIEGHPKALLEAMSSGLSCIGSDISGIRDIIIDKENGLLFEMENNKDLSLKIDTLIENKELRNNLSKTARSYVENNFSLSKMLDKEIELLKNP